MASEVSRKEFDDLKNIVRKLQLDFKDLEKSLIAEEDEVTEDDEDDEDLEEEDLEGEDE